MHLLWKGRGEVSTANVILFKPRGKFYTEEAWRIPDDAIGPYDMDRSPDFRRISGGAVLVESQEPWGFPHLFPSAHDNAVTSDARVRDRAIEAGARVLLRPDVYGLTLEDATEFAAAVVDEVTPVLLEDALRQWRAVDDDVFASADEVAKKHRKKLMASVTALKPDEFGRISKGLVQAMIMGEVE